MLTTNLTVGLCDNISYIFSQMIYLLVVKNCMLKFASILVRYILRMVITKRPVKCLAMLGKINLNIFVLNIDILKR